jgi:chromosomal replication initiation ATPase DnaA
MYVAARVGRWSTTAIGHFYNGRDHSTVCDAIARIESFKETNPEVDALLSDLEHALQARPDGQNQEEH